MTRAALLARLDTLAQHIIGWGAVAIIVSIAFGWLR